MGFSEGFSHFQLKSSIGLVESVWKWHKRRRRRSVTEEEDLLVLSTAPHCRRLHRRMEDIYCFTPAPSPLWSAHAILSGFFAILGRFTGAGEWEEGAGFGLWKKGRDHALQSSNENEGRKRRSFRNSVAGVFHTSPSSELISITDSSRIVTHNTEKFIES